VVVTACSAGRGRTGWKQNSDTSTWHTCGCGEAQRGEGGRCEPSQCAASKISSLARGMSGHFGQPLPQLSVRSGECKVPLVVKETWRKFTLHIAHAKDRHTHMQFRGSSHFLVLPYEPVDHVEVVPHGHFLCLEHANHGIGVSAIVLIMRVAHRGGCGHNSTLFQFSPSEYTLPYALRHRRDGHTTQPREQCTEQCWRRHDQLRCKPRATK
jgi:hypothetical protein